MGNRFLAPTVIGLIRLGHDVVWFGRALGGLDWFSDDLSKIIFKYDYTVKDIEEQLDADVVIMNYSYWDHTGIVNLLNKRLPNRYYVLSGMDTTGGQCMIPGIKFQYKSLLKREALPCCIKRGVVPFSGLAVPETFQRNLPKKYSVSAVWNNNGCARFGFCRSGISNILSSIPDSKIHLTTGGLRLYESEKYIDIINESHISVSAWGAGYLCYRDIETIASNTIPAIMNNPIGAYNDLGTSIIRFNNAKEAHENITRCLADPIRMTDMLQKKKELVQLYYTPAAKATELLNKL